MSMAALYQTKVEISILSDEEIPRLDKVGKLVIKCGADMMYQSINPIEIINSNELSGAKWSVKVRKLEEI